MKIRYIPFAIIFVTAPSLVNADLPAGATSFKRDAADGRSHYSVALETSGFGSGKSYAVVSGIYDYEKWSRISWVKNDLVRMKDSLVDNQGFDEVVVIEREHVSTESLSQIFNYFEEKITSKDRFLFYFSGHGIDREKANGEIVGLLPLVDSELTVGIDDGAISMSTLWDWFTQISKANHSLFVLDSCFSGLAGTEPKGRGKPTPEQIRIGRLLNRGHYLMTAGAHNQESLGSAEWGGSLFTNVLVQGMLGAADTHGSDGIVSFGELLLFTKTELDALLLEIAQREWNEGRTLIPELTPQFSNLSINNVGEIFFINDSESVDITYNPVQLLADAGDFQLKGISAAASVNFQDIYLKSKDNATGDYFTIVGSFKKLTDARDFARRIRAEHPDLYAVVYDRYEGSEYYAVVLSAFVRRAEAEVAQVIAQERGIAPDAYLWKFP